MVSTKIKTYHIPIATTLQIRWKMNVDVLMQLQEWAFNISNNLTCSIQININTIIVHGLSIGDKNRTQSYIQPILSDSVESIELEEMSGVDAVKSLEDASLRPTAFKAKSGIANRYVPYDFFINILESLHNQPPNDGIAITIFPMGGKVNQVHRKETAFYHRKSIFWIQIVIHWDDPQLEEGCLQWVNYLHSKIKPYLSPYVYPNWPDMDIIDYEHAYYGSNIKRLKHIKHKYDPNNRFKFKQSISP